MHQSKAEMTREKLMTVALELFSSRGFHATGIRDIATAAGVSTGLAYNYFPTKGDILGQLVLEHANRLTTTTAAFLQNCTELDAHHLARFLMQWINAEAPSIRLIWSLAILPVSVHEIPPEALEHLQIAQVTLDNLLVGTPIDPPLLRSLILGITIHHLSSPHGLNEDEIRRQLQFLFG